MKPTTHLALASLLRSYADGRLSAVLIGLESGLSTAGVIDARAVWVLNKYRKGTDASMPTRADYTQAINLKQE